MRCSAVVRAPWATDARRSVVAVPPSVAARAFLRMPLDLRDAEICVDLRHGEPDLAVADNEKLVGLKSGELRLDRARRRAQR